MCVCVCASAGARPCGCARTLFAVFCWVTHILNHSYAQGGLQPVLHSLCLWCGKSCTVISLVLYLRVSSSFNNAPLKCVIKRSEGDIMSNKIIAYLYQICSFYLSLRPLWFMSCPSTSCLCPSVHPANSRGCSRSVCWLSWRLLLYCFWPSPPPSPSQVRGTVMPENPPFTSLITSDNRTAPYWCFYHVI